MIAFLIVLTMAAPPTEAQRAALALEKTLQKNATDLHRCFEKALADRLDASGKMEIELEVGAGGQVAKARVLSQGKEVAPSLSDCVRISAVTWRVEGIEPGATVLLPFTFAGQANQFVVKIADIPDRGPKAGKPKGQAGPTPTAPFTVKVLADEVNMRARQASLTLLSVGPASRVAMHRHPRSGKALYLLKGHARLLGPAGAEPQKLEAGMVAFVPAGYPHVIENMGRQSTAVFLQAFVPPGPERVYRDPTDPQGRADFEVIRDPKVAAPAGAKILVRSAADSAALPILGGKGTARILIEEATLAVSLVEFTPGVEIPRHSHEGASELLYIVEGAGVLSVGSETYPFTAESVIHVPADQPHGAKIGAEKTTAVQIYAPGGPEQRFKIK